MAVPTERPTGSPDLSGDQAPLGILACAGALPLDVARAVAGRGRAVHIVGIDEFASNAISQFPHERVRLGQLGRLLRSFAGAGVREIVIAGAMQRPNLWTLRFDLGFIRHLPTILSLTRGGDDRILRGVVRFFERQGLAVVGVPDVAPELLAGAGAIGLHQPDERHRLALERAARLIDVLGPFDVGQGVVATADAIIAVEGVRGTDAMLRDLATEGLGAGLGQGSVLVKQPKPGQEMRIDMPTIGTETVRHAAAAGLAGIGVRAGGAIVLERAAVAEAADAAQVFVMGLSNEREGRVSCADASGNDVPTANEMPGVLEVVSRRAPTPSERRDIAIGRRLIGVLEGHGAGVAATVAREHVTAIAGGLALVPFVEAQGTARSTGRRSSKHRRGVLVIGKSAGANVLDDALFRSAMAAGLAGVVFLGGLGEGEVLSNRVAWANEAGVFLLAAETPA